MKTNNDFVVYKEYRDANDLLNEVVFNRAFSGPFGSILFRGEPSSNYSLLPSALRPENIGKLLRDAESFDEPPLHQSLQLRHEQDALNTFFNLADMRGLTVPNLSDIREEFVGIGSANWHSKVKKPMWLPVELRELAGLAQHYGIQTRLLDWSCDVLVALYFASYGVIRKHENGSFDKNDYIVLWILNVMMFEFTQSFEYPLKVVRPPYKDNPNLAAQSGAFTLWEQTYSDAVSSIERRPLDVLLNETPVPSEVRNRKILYKCLVPVSECFKLYNALSNFNYDASKLFPGYDGITRAIHEKYMMKKFQDDSFLKQRS